MKNLLYKELVLCTNVSVFIFTLFGAVMMIVPDYPHYVGFYYTTLSVMLLFTQGTANNDAVYTACLPVRRRDIVKARVLCVAFLELFCLAVSIPSAVAAALFLPGWKSADGLPAAALYSIVFVQYALFNVSFLVLCYRKSGKPALAFFVGSIAYWVGFFCRNSTHCGNRPRARVHVRSGRYVSVNAPAGSCRRDRRMGRITAACVPYLRETV